MDCVLPERFPREYGGYRLTALLGSGGSADVYRAEIPVSPGTPRKEVAIRRVARGVGRDQHVLAILFEESRAWVTLRHPNIVAVLDIGEHGEDYFLVLELVEGLAASQIALAEGPLPVDEAFLIAADVADALHYGHSHSIAGRRVVIVHRDVKPANVLLSVDGGVKLTDFGIARTNDRLGRTAAGVVRGSLHYISPEQVRREDLTPRTDLYALGCALHNLLTGLPLIDLPKDAIFRLLDRGDIPPPHESLPPDVRQVIRELTAGDPALRPADANEASARLRALVGKPEPVRERLAARVRSALAQMQRSASAETADTTAPIGALPDLDDTQTSPRRRG